jgi:diguanylate cyclase (GGDEF)-like protein
MLSTWTTLSRLGTDVALPEDSRAISASNHFFILAILANIPWLVLLGILGGPTPAPFTTHLALVMTWAAGLWLNRLGMALLASLLGLLAPIMEFTYLASIYTRAGAFQLQLLAIPALAFALLPARRWALRFGVILVGAVVLGAIYVVPSFGVLSADVSRGTVHVLAALNVISTLALLYTIAAFNSYYFQRERARNTLLLTEAQTAARTDSLTEALNRRGIAPVMAAAARKGPYALALVDLDRFKRINDALGHGAGDVVLSNVARSIARAVGDRGTVARWGGEEFLVVIPQVSLAEAVEMMDRTRAEIEDEYTMDGLAERVTISAGVAHGRQFAAKEEMLRLADAMLYEAKASGRNLVVGGEVGSVDRD